ncbi:hypothetical protein E4665_11465 [Sporolactobacillus shoreae]|uniref:Uncharacterized protein n=1 Tax=Sporolactobacillus shoreae TaxID=1465501 RepID=A0A4Z0GLR8_9BACL|nr:hypothetical protein [Sporolactobacillus shoreae]TGA97711.1 hypothetical protein E4665_11465 [Sporolactobacillus shoreae]
MKLRRRGRYCNADRLTIECFGEDITSLISEVFCLEITDSEFHNLLRKMVDQYDDYEDIISKCNGQIGTEGRALIKVMLAIKEEEKNDD